MKGKKTIILFVVLSSLVVIGFIGFKWVQDNILNQFQSFSVLINNESEYDIISLETGIIKGTSKDVYDTKIKSGENIKIKPVLTLIGEGAIYLKYTDSRGASKEVTVCGYTEYLSGNLMVSISNDKVNVEGRCM